MGIARVVGHATTFALALCLSVPAASAISKEEQAAVDATADQAAAKMRVKDDPMETFIEVDSEPFYQAHEGLLKVVNSDKFLRAFIDRKANTVAYQVYVWASYDGSWAFLDRANLQTDDGPIRAEVHRVNSEVGYCGRYSCTHREDIAIDAPESVLRWAARDAQPGTGQDWLIRIGGQSGVSGDIRILKTEVAGFLQAVDRERQRLDALKTQPRAIILPQECLHDRSLPHCHPN
jgi:hypothetical protein